MNYRFFAIDRNVVVGLLTKQRSTVVVSPGTYNVGVFCYAWGKWRERELSTSLAQGEVKYFRLSGKIPDCAQIEEIPVGAASAAAKDAKQIPVGTIGTR